MEINFMSMKIAFNFNFFKLLPVFLVAAAIIGGVAFYRAKHNPHKEVPVQAISTNIMDTFPTTE